MTLRRGLSEQADLRIAQVKPAAAGGRNQKAARKAQAPEQGER